MAKCVFDDGKLIEDYGNPYFVIEVNSSHQGNIKTAKEMIDAASEAGGDCVKFQSWSKDTLYSKTYYDANPMSERFVKKFSLQPDQLLELAEYCRNKGIQFSSTPYSKEEVDFLVNECDVPFVKVASMEVDNPSFLKYIARTGKPIVLSTGMSDAEEIDKCISLIRAEGENKIVLLHCVSIYPTDIITVNLNNIIGFREKYPDIPIGFSDHTIGDEASISAVALGACLIEKHLTLDRKSVGMDNGMATEPDELKTLIFKCNNAYRALGSRDRVVSQAEIEQRTKMRRSIVFTRDMKKGELIAENCLDAKRPGTGISPDRIEMVLGKKLIRDVEKDTLISLDDIEK